MTGKTGRYLKLRNILGPFFQVAKMCLAATPIQSHKFIALSPVPVLVLHLEIKPNPCAQPPSRRLFFCHGNAMSKYFSLIHFFHPFMSLLVCLCISFIQLSPEALLPSCIELLCNLHIQISPSATLHFLGSLAICQPNVK